MKGSTENDRWVLASRPKGAVGPENFRRDPVGIPSAGPDQLVVRNRWLYLAPTQVLMTAEENGAAAIPIGGVMHSPAMGEVVESRIPGFQPGDLVTGVFGWEKFSLVDADSTREFYYPTVKLGQGIPLPRAVGSLGLNGMAAYFGVTEVGRPVPGETFLVTSAAGGVGSMAGQIAKIRGARVIGIAGGRQRCDRLVNELGFDAAIDRRTEPIGPRLDEIAPEGVDVYFDNSSGPEVDEILARLRRLARVVLCGSTSIYLADELPPGPKQYRTLITKSARIQGHLARNYRDRFPEAQAAMEAWVREGKLRPTDDVIDGLENAPKALARVFRGENFGTQLLRIDGPEPSNADS